MSKKWTTLGTLRKDINGNRNLVLAKGIRIISTLQDGTEVEVDLGQYRIAKCFDAVESINKSIAAGRTTEEKAQKQLDYIADKKISFEVVVPPKREE